MAVAWWSILREVCVFETLRESMSQLKEKHLLEWKNLSTLKDQQRPFCVSGGAFNCYCISLWSNWWRNHLFHPGTVFQVFVAPVLLLRGWFMAISQIFAEIWKPRFHLFLQQRAVQVLLSLSMLNNPVGLLCHFYSIPSQWQESRSENNVRNINQSLEKKQ